MAKERYPIALACSDTHWSNWKQFNKNGYRMTAQFNMWLDIYEVARKKKIPILFSGDLVDHPKYVDNVLLDVITDSLQRLPKKVKFIGINGNHDFPYISTYKDQVIGYLRSFSRLIENVECVDFGYTDYGNLRVHGIPYINGDVDFIEALQTRIVDIDHRKKNILLIHRDLAGAVEPDGKTVKKDPEKDKTLKRKFKAFDLVLSGHIHKPQQITKLGKHIYMLGATHQQRRSDAGCKMGYWIIYNDLSMKFHSLEAPEFKYYKDGEEPEDEYNFWLKKPEIKSKEENESTGNFNVKADRKDLIKNYMKEKGVKSKSKLKLALKYL